jgi:hypothetical protein
MLLYSSPPRRLWYAPFSLRDLGYCGSHSVSPLVSGYSSAKQNHEQNTTIIVQRFTITTKTIMTQRNPARRGGSVDVDSGKCKLLPAPAIAEHL